MMWKKAAALSLDWALLLIARVTSLSLCFFAGKMDIVFLSPGLLEEQMK